MDAGLLLMAPQVTTGALDPHGSPSLILLFPLVTLLHTRRRAAEKTTTLQLIGAGTHSHLGSPQSSLFVGWSMWHATLEVIGVKPFVGGANGYQRAQDV